MLSLCGVLAAAFVPTFGKHLRFSKLAEATEQLDDMYRSTAAYYAGEHRVGVQLTRGCLPESAGPVPPLPSAKPVAVDFALPDVAGRATWQALGMNGTATLRYSYQLSVAEPGCGPRPSPTYPAVLFRATGDLDGDGVHSVLERTAAISADQRALMPVIPLRVLDRVE